jgi:16S rRNA (uracil1498-N3)-methyltransferase
LNRVVLFDHDKINSFTFSLKDKKRIGHLLDHLKVQKGDQLKATVINSGLTTVEVLNLSAEEINFKVIADYQSPQNRTLTLYVATSRPPTMKKVIEHGTTLGVSHFHFFTARLSEKSYLKSKVLDKENLNELATLGIAQSGNLWKIPTFEFSTSLAHATQEIAPPYYTLSLNEGSTLLQSGPNFKDHLKFFIGPERGWTKDEEQFLKDKGSQPIVLSKHILRVETAAFALLSQLELLEISG